MTTLQHRHLTLKILSAWMVFNKHLTQSQVPGTIPRSRLSSVCTTCKETASIPRKNARLSMLLSKTRSQYARHTRKWEFAWLNSKVAIAFIGILRQVRLVLRRRILIVLTMRRDSASWDVSANISMATRRIKYVRIICLGSVQRGLIARKLT